MLTHTRRRPAYASDEDHRGGASHSAAASVVGNVAKFMLTRSVLKRVSRVGGLQGMLISAVATYAIDRVFSRHRR